MGRSPLTAIALKRLLDQAAEPIYLVDQHCVLLYVNDALAAWLGRPREELIGLRLSYQTATGPGHLAEAPHGLCRPPHLGEETESFVVHDDPSVGMERRRVWWIPLQRSESNPTVWMAWVQDQRATESSAAETGASWSQDECQRLHAALWEFRVSMSRRYESHWIVGVSVASQRIRRQVDLAGASDCSVVVTGPPGSGREHVARTIHFADPRRLEVPIVALHCQHLDAEHLTSTARGLAARCAELGTPLPGTLLLLEVEHLPSGTQVALSDLLRGTEQRVRYLATAAVDWKRAVAKERSRELVERLSTLEIPLPPLADRRDDIPLLAQALVERWNSESEKQLAGLTAEAIDQLFIHQWIRGIDELAETVWHGCRQSPGPLIRVVDLPGQLEVARGAARLERGENRQLMPLDDHLRQVEAEQLREAWSRSRGNKAKAARMLGISRARFLRRIEQLRVQVDD